MNEFNPVIGNTAHETLDAMIDVLQLNITLLSRFRQVPEDDILKTWLTAADINGLCLLLDGLKRMAEACYAQCYQAQSQESEKESEKEGEEEKKGRTQSDE